jgi:RNA polymerase sigma factor (sigma-70 family)
LTGDIGGAEFEALLAALDQDRDRAGERYESLRAKLVKNFTWEGAIDAEDLADQALTRLARRIADGERVQNLSAYLGGVTRMLLMESQRAQSRRGDELPEIPVMPAEPEEEDRCARCLERCLADLPDESRSLIIRYYEGDEGARIRNRHKLAMELGLTMNSLRNRALRLREKIERCVEECRNRDGSAPNVTKEWTRR